MSLAYLMLTLAVLSWAGNWVIGRALRFDAPPVAITFWRWAVAFAVLVPFTWSYVRDEWRIVLRSWRIVGLLGALATVCQHIPIYIGLRHTTATNGALLNATSPIFIALLAIILTGARLSAKQVIGSIVSLAGVAAVVSQGDLDVLRALSVNAGDMWVLIGTLSWAAYTVALRWRPAGVHELAFLTVLAAVGVVETAPLYALEVASGLKLELNAASVLGIGYIAIAATVAGYIFWNRGVHEIGPARAGPFMYLMLVFTPALSIMFLGERLHLYHLAGGLLIVAGIYLTTGRFPAERHAGFSSRS
jgi:drug/metabolite transporter (DMT)-like permease